MNADLEKIVAALDAFMDDFGEEKIKLPIFNDLDKKRHAAALLVEAYRDLKMVQKLNKAAADAGIRPDKE